MNVALFTDSYYPQINGVATSVHMLKRELEARGHTVYVFTTTEPGVDRRAERKQGIFRLRSIPVMSERRLGLFPSPRMIRFITHLKIDLIHTHTEFSLGILGRSVAWYFNLPIVHTYHTIYEYYTHYVVKAGFLDSFAKKAVRSASASVCNQAEAVVVPTKKVQRLLRTYGVYRPIAVIPTGITTERFHRREDAVERRAALRAEMGFAMDERILLYLGRVSDEKDIDQVIRSLEALLKRDPKTRMLVVGDGPAREELERLTAALGLEEKIYFAGQRPWDTIADYYHMSDLFVTASQSETQGLTYIEALASGLPVIAKDDLCLEGVVENGVNGWRWTDQASLESALEELWPGEAKLERMSAAATESAERYTAESFAKKIEQLYEQVLDRFVETEQIKAQASR